MDAPGGFDYTSGYTFSSWVKIDAGGISNRFHVLFSVGTTAASDIEIYIQSTTGKVAVVHNRTNGGTNDFNFTDGSILPDNEYAHLAVTYTGSTMTIFLNGVQQHSVSLVAPIKTATSKMVIGRILNTNFPGAEDYGEFMDDVRVYNKALTAAEILSDYNRPLGGSEDDLIAYFPFDEATAGVATKELVSNTDVQIVGNAVLTTDFGLSTSFNCSTISEDITIGDNIAPVVLAEENSNAGHRRYRSCRFDIGYG